MVFYIHVKCLKISRECERILDIIRDAQKSPNIFMWLSFTKGYRGTSEKWKDPIQIPRPGSDADLPYLSTYLPYLGRPKLVNPCWIDSNAELYSAEIN